MDILYTSDSEAVFQGISMSDDVLKELLYIIRRRMTPHPVKIRARKYYIDI
jgi:translation initiation factor 2 subunit 1